jgi:hypothetical protein
MTVEVVLDEKEINAVLTYWSNEVFHVQGASRNIFYPEECERIKYLQVCIEKLRFFTEVLRHTRLHKDENDEELLNKFGLTTIEEDSGMANGETAPTPPFTSSSESEEDEKLAHGTHYLDTTGEVCRKVF